MSAVVWYVYPYPYPYPHMHLSVGGVTCVTGAQNGAPNDASVANGGTCENDENDETFAKTVASDANVGTFAIDVTRDADQYRRRS